MRVAAITQRAAKVVRTPKGVIGRQTEGTMRFTALLVTLAWIAPAVGNGLDYPPAEVVMRAKSTALQDFVRVRLHPSLDRAPEAQLAALARIASSVSEAAKPVRMPNGDYRILSTNRAALIAALRMDQAVLWAEPDREKTRATSEERFKLAIREDRERRRLLVSQFNDVDLRLDRAAKATLLTMVEQVTGHSFELVRRSVLGYWELRSALELSTLELYDAELRLIESGQLKGVLAGYPVSTELTPNDPLAGGGGQWSLYSPATGLIGIGAQAAWDITTGDPNLVIAVVDTGILPHPDLASRVVQGIDLIAAPARANDGTGRDSSPIDPGDWFTVGQCGSRPAENSSWHGTHVAGTIGAVTNNGLGIAGINWNSKIQPIRVLGRCGGDTIDIVFGMLWAAGIDLTEIGLPINPSPARVINMSLGGPGQCSGTQQGFVDAVLARGALVVAAAGNESDLADNRIPASCFGLSTVGATDWQGDRASYSNVSFYMDISAPGGDTSRYGADGGILSTHNAGTTTAGAHTYKALQGTSMAAPHVSGVASLMLSVNPSLTPAQLKALMAATATPFKAGSACNIGICGAGIVNAATAVLAAQLTAGPATTTTVVEYFHAGFGHYFVTGYPSEITALDTNPALKAAWARTGQTFKGYSQATSGAVTVHRFFTDKPMFGGRSSHFYTGLTNEYNALLAGNVWDLEGPGFYVKLPSGQTCPAAHSPVYRMYNNAMGGAPNHRFTTLPSIYSDFVNNRGWAGEGVVFCAPN